MGLFNWVAKKLGYTKEVSKPTVVTEKVGFFGKQSEIPKSAIKTDVFGDPVLTPTQMKFEKAKAKILSNLTPERKQLEIKYIVESDEYHISSP